MTCPKRTEGECCHHVLSASMDDGKISVTKTCCWCGANITIEVKRLAPVLQDLPHGPLITRHAPQIM